MRGTKADRLKGEGKMHARTKRDEKGNGKKGGEDKDGQGSKGKAHLLAGKVRVEEYESAGVRERLEKRKCWSRPG